jgi:hypothetical protein
MRRYNDLGEWKPFVIGGDDRFAESAAAQLAGDALDLSGPLFYVFYTGFKVLEFVVCTSFALPTQELSLFDGQLHLWTCAKVQPMQTEIVYDGSWTLSSSPW